MARARDGPNEAYEIHPGHDAWVTGDEAWVAIDWAGMRFFAAPSPAAVSASSRRSSSPTSWIRPRPAVRLGDSAWRELLARHNEKGRDELDRFRGREIDTTGDGFLALFDSPSERSAPPPASVSPRRRSVCRRAPASTPARSSW